LKRFKIDTRLPLDNNIRMVLENIILNMALYKSTKKKPDITIHQSRKSIKRIRAILKMIRYGTGYSFYQRENLFFRDLSRRMASARDFSVLLQTMKLMEQKYREKFQGKDLQRLRNQLSTLKQEQILPLTVPQGGLAAIAEELDKALPRIKSTLDVGNEFRCIGTGMKKTYRRARRYLQDMGDLSSAETLHEYRKNCRNLQYQVELVQPLFPDLLKAYATTLDNHSELLGKIRDFQRFELYLQGDLSEVITIHGKENMQHAIRQLRLRAMAGIYKNAGLIFAEKPGNFIDRIQLYWNLHYSIN
jgi:CHAD domain-containing protein